MADYTSDLIIEELDPNGGTRRALYLSGPTLPLMGATWKGEQKLKTRWYQGNPEATQQVLGPRLLPSEWQGEWHRTMMGQHPATWVDESGIPANIIDPHLLVEVFDNLKNEGRRLRVTWTQRLAQGAAFNSNDPSAVSAKKVREGRIASFEARVFRAQDIEWSCNFEWASAVLVTQRAVAAGEKGAISADPLAAAIDAFAVHVTGNRIIKSNPKIRASASRFTLGRLEALVDAPVKIVNGAARNLTSIENQVKQAVTIGSKVVNLPWSIVSSLTIAARNALSIANRTRDVIDRMPAERMSANHGVSDVLRAWDYFGKSSSGAEVIARRAAELRERAQQQRPAPPLQGDQGPQASRGGVASGDVEQVYRTKPGDTPQKLSQKFYGSPDHAVDILKANRLPWYLPTFPTGKPIIIPVLRQAGRGV